MTEFTLYTRSFHPDRNFGLMGLGFKGDARGFSTSIKDTSRISHSVTIDLVQARYVDAAVTSDPSANSVLPRVLEGRGARAAGIWAGDELADIGVPTKLKEAGQARDWMPPMQNDYSQKRKLPRHNIQGNITPYREDGDQAVNGRLSYAGKNFAFYFADTDLGHRFFGGDISDGGSDTNGGDLAVWKRWGGMVPDLDVTHEFSLHISRANKSIQISSVISGDGFPNCESFLIDSSGKALFLGTHIRIGSAATQLPGGRALPMTRTMMVVDWLPGDLFGANVEVQIAIDYTGDGGPKQVSAAGGMSLDAWNGKHKGREASGDWLRGVEDNVPLFRQTIRQAGERLDYYGEQIRKAF